MERVSKRHRARASGGQDGPRVPKCKRAFSVIGGPVEKAGDARELGLVGDLLNPDPGLARVLTHGFHSYAGRMHPGTARRAIEQADIVRLSLGDQQRFAKALLAPPRPSAALKRAIARHDKLLRTE